MLGLLVDIKRIYNGLVLYHDTYPGGPSAWLANEREPSFIFKNIAYAIETALGDGVVVRILLIFGTLSPFPSQIYRSYMVWRSVWVIIVPFILWLGVCGKWLNMTSASFLNRRVEPLAVVRSMNSPNRRPPQATFSPRVRSHGSPLSMRSPYPVISLQLVLYPSRFPAHQIESQPPLRSTCIQIMDD
jgi:hypothetical protein